MANRYPRRAELLCKIVDELLERGVGDLSLRPLADRVGTSARLLIFHFGSKDELLAAALAEVRRHVEDRLSARGRQVRPMSLRSMIMLFWDWSTAAANQRYFRLLFEVDGLTLFDRVRFSRETQQTNSSTWTSLIDSGVARLPSGERVSPSVATLLMCATKGLLQEFLATGDLEGTTAALAVLVDDLAPEARALRQANV